MKIYNSSSVELVDVVLSNDSYRSRRIMGENALTLKVELFTHTDIPIGSYCDYQGEKYTLLKPQNITKHNSRNFEYTIIFEAAISRLGSYKLRDFSKRLKFSLTQKPERFLQLIVDNMNQREYIEGVPATKWAVGTCIEMSEKVISFNHNYCNEALKMIADEFQTEFEIVGKTISLGKVEYNKSTPLALSYGFYNGFKSGVKRENFDNSKKVEVLFVQGGEKNIYESKYSSRELLLPKDESLSYQGRNYISDSLGYYIINADRPLSTNVEDSLDCSHIYPSRVGTVSSVIAVDVENNIYDFIDSSIPEDLDYIECLTQGEKMTVIFQSGMLTGKEFDVNYFHADRRFRIVWQDIDGVKMPNEDFKPAFENKYAVFGISLPDAYVDDPITKTGASWDMFREAATYLFENEDDRFSFTGSLDGIWAKKNWLTIGGKIKLGGYVSFTDEQFQSSPALIRIVGIKDYINSPYSPQIELSNVTVGGGFSNALRKLETTEVVIETTNKDSIRFAKRGFREAKETAKLLEAALLNFSGAVNPISVKTMQILLGDESLQFRFVNSKTTPVEVSHDIVFNTGNKILTCEGGIIQHMTLGIETISSSHAVSEYKFWDVPEYELILDVPSKSYYLYSKVSKSDQTGVFLLSETAIAMEAVLGYYHLLVAIVNSEYDSDRSIVPLYGYTEILPGRVTTKKIVSPDGSTFFDLEHNEIGGNIKFKSGDTYTNVGTGIAGAITTAANDATTKANAARAAAEAVGNEAWNYADQAYIDATAAGVAANTAQAGVSALNYLKIALAGSTEIAGGIVATHILLLKNALEEITGGLSGIDDDNIGFWTGGTYNDAVSGLAKTILRKDGSGQLAGGNINWNALGDLSLKGVIEALAGKIAGFSITEKSISCGDLLISGNHTIDPLSYLYSPPSVLLAVAPHWTQENVPAPEEVVIETAQITTVFYGQVSLGLQAYARDTIDSGTWRDCTVIIECYTGAGNLVFSEEAVTKTPDWYYSKYFYLDPGTYYFKLKAKKHLLGNYINASRQNDITISFVQNKTFIGRAGLYSYLSANGNLLYYDRFYEGLLVKGKMNIPGILACGSIASDKTHSNKWGAKVATALQSVELENVVEYKIPHSIGHSSYTIQLTSNESSKVPYVFEKAADYIKVVQRTLSGVTTLGSFDYVIMGHNNIDV